MTAARGRLLFIALVLVALTLPVEAGTISDAVDRFRDAARTEQAVVVDYAKRLFVLLAVIGGAWEIISLMFDRADIASWAGAFMRRVLWFLTFWVILIYGPHWATQIVQSLQQIGSQASGVYDLSPEGILGVGEKVCMKLLHGAGTYGFFSGEWAVGFTMFFAGIAIFASFAFVAIQFTILLVLTYIGLSLGSIFLGFGGSKWTVAYTERFFALAISIGIKFLTLMFIVGIGLTFGDVLTDAAAGAAASENPDSVALEIVTAAGLLALCAWQVPKIFSTIMTGTPAFGAGEFFAAVGAMVAGAMAATSIASAGISAVGAAGSSVAGLVGGATGGGGGADPGSVTSSGSGSVPPPGGGSGGGGGGTGGGGSSSGGGAGEIWTGPGSATWAASAATGGGSDVSGSGGDGGEGIGDSAGAAGGSGGGGGASVGPSPSRAGQATSSHAWRQAGARLRQAGYQAQNALGRLSNDGGHGGGGPGLHIG